MKCEFASRATGTRILIVLVAIQGCSRSLYKAQHCHWDVRCFSRHCFHLRSCNLACMWRVMWDVSKPSRISFHHVFVGQKRFASSQCIAAREPHTAQRNVSQTGVTRFLDSSHHPPPACQVAGAQMKAEARKAANISVAVLCFVQAATAALNSDERTIRIRMPVGLLTAHTSLQPPR